MEFFHKNYQYFKSKETTNSRKREGKAKDKGLVLFESGHDKRHKQTQSSDKEEGEITDTD